MSGESDSESAISPKTDDIDYWTRVASRAARKEYGAGGLRGRGKIEPGLDVTLHFDISIWRRAGTLPFDPATRVPPRYTGNTSRFLQPCPRKNYCIIRGTIRLSLSLLDSVYIYNASKKYRLCVFWYQVRFLISVF